MLNVLEMLMENSVIAMSAVDVLMILIVLDLLLPQSVMKQQVIVYSAMKIITLAPH